MPEVDLGRLYVAGRGSAAAVALLFAEHTRYAKGCLAFAPIVDLAAQTDAARQERLRRFGLGDVVGRLSPRAGESRLDSPVFLFQARDDSTVPVEATEAFAERLRGMGKAVTLELVDEDGHDEGMAREGLRRGVAWLKARDAEVRAGAR